MTGSNTLIGIANPLSATNNMNIASASTTHAFGLGCSGGVNGDAGGTGAAESRCSQTCRESGTISNLYANIVSNSRSSSSTTFKSRKNSADGNLTASIAASTTGVISDLTHSDSVSSSGTPDTFNGAVTSGSGSGTLVFCSFVEQFQRTNTGSAMIWANTSMNGSTSNVESDSLFTASVTRIMGWGGGSSGIGIFNTTTANEANMQFTVRTAATLQNLQVQVSSNSRTNATTLTNRIGAADATSTVSPGSGATGLFEDTTHTDSLSSGNLLNLDGTTGTTNNNFIVPRMSATLLASTAASDLIAGAVTAGASATADFTYGTGATHYIPILGGGFNQSAEANAQITMPFQATATLMRAHVIVNTSTGWTTTFRIGGSDGAQTYSVGSSATGLFEDTTHSDSLSAGNIVNIKKTSNNVAAQINAWGLTLSSSVDATVNLTGVSGSGSAAATTPEVDKSLTGVSGSGAAASATPEIDKPLTGVSGAGAANAVTVTYPGTVNLMGVSAHGAAGTTTETFDYAVNAVGVSAAGAVNPVGITFDSNVFVMGVAAAGHVNAVTPVAVSPTILLPIFSIMRDVPVAANGNMSDDVVPAIGSMTNVLPIFSLMRNTPVASNGSMSNTPVAATGSLFAA